MFTVEFVLVGPSGEKTIPVGSGKGWTFLIGRSDEADLFLNDPGVSRRHCRAFPQDRTVAVEDLGSRSGTYVNGKRIERPTGLTDGDVLKIGGITLRAAVVHEPTDGYAAEAAETSAPAPPFPELPEDRTIVAAAMPESQAPAETEQIEIALAGTTEVTFGRDPAADVTIDSPAVSRRHAVVRAEGAAFMLRDLGSTNGTYVNGERVDAPRALKPGDVVGIGPYHLGFDGARLVSRKPERGMRIEVQALGKRVIHRETGKPLHLLRDIGLTIKPKEFVGLLGSSGCGKSTFMDTANGRRPATEGRVLYNGENLYNRFDAFKQGIGYVPQELIFHEDLPLCDVLRYASRLRLPDDTSDAEIEKNIGRVLETVGLADRGGTLVRNLSGGQKKRVSIAIELLAQPTVLFLDEATSGLDLGTEAQMMKLFRELADGGVTTMCITHFVESLEMCDVLAYFVQGRLAYYGPPDKLKSHFGVKTMREVYVKETEKTAEEWEAEFRATDEYREFVAERATPSQDAENTIVRVGQPISNPPPRDPKKQYQILRGRYVQTLFGDRKNALTTFGIAPVIGLLASLALGKADGIELEGQVANMLSLVVFFLGIFGSIREIVKELPIYRHERFVNLGIIPYLASKAVPLAAVVVVQTFAILFVVHSLLDTQADFTQQCLILSATGIAGMLLGLMVSAAVDASDKAVMFMIVAVIPQILFMNAAIKLPDPAKLLAKVFVVCYWSYDGMKGIVPGLENTEGSHGWFPDLLMLLVVCAAYAWLARWFLRKKDVPYGRVQST